MSIYVTSTEVALNRGTDQWTTPTGESPTSLTPKAVQSASAGPGWVDNVTPVRKAHDEVLRELGPNDDRLIKLKTAFAIT